MHTHVHIHRVINSYVFITPYMFYIVYTQPSIDSQSDITWKFIGRYGELEGEYHTHTDGHWDDQLNDLLGSMTKSSLQ